MSAPVNVSEGPQYTTGKDACRALGISPRTLRKLAGRHLIGVRQIPGVPPRYLKSDVDRILADSERPAMAGSK